jgi:ribonuclease HI
MKETKIIQWNLHGLRANLVDLQLLIADFSPVALCLQETLQKTTNIINLRKYTHFFTTNTAIDGRPKGGVSILVDKTVPHSQVTLTSPVQAVAVRITLHRPLTLCSIYLPPSTPVDANDLNLLINQLPHPVILMGDFNAHSPLWGNDKLDNRGHVIETVIENNNLFLFNNKSKTYLHPATGSRTAIDLTLCHPTLATDFTWSVSQELYGSDHYPLIITNQKLLPQCHFPKWKIHKSDWHLFQNSCEQTLTYQPTNNKNDMEHFTTILIDIAKCTIPKTKQKPRHPIKPWFTDQCKTAISERRKALRTFCTSPSTENLINFKKVRAQTRKIIQQCKKSSWESFVSKLNNRTSSKQIWDMIRKIKGNPSPMTSHHIKQNNILTTHQDEICNILAKSFAHNSSNAHYSPTFQTHKQTLEAHNINFNSTNQEDYNLPFSLTELTSAITASRNSTPGPDDIHYQFLKKLPLPSLQLLLHIMNNNWTNHTFPATWQEAIVIPILKPNKDPTDPNSYRPIALTSCLCKIMESMVNKRLVFYLESNQLISEYQCGFRKQRSTTDQLIRLETWVREGLANGEHVVAIFYDLEKAYDTTWKYGILRDLHNSGLRGHLPIFISNFLNNRHFKVRSSHSLSQNYDQECGVPQGSVLSPTLFNLKINSITKCIPIGVDCTLFVDDFLTCCRSKLITSIERRLQITLNNLQKWSDENGFKFSPTKTHCIHFCNLRRLHPHPNLTLNNQPVPVVSETKFLGVIFDNKLTFIPHLKYLRTKCLKAMNILRVVAHKDWGGDTKTLLTLYRTLIRTKLDYASIVWGSARQSYVQMLDPIQNQALRLCLGAFRTSPIESLQVECFEPNLSMRRQKLTMQYITKLKSNPLNPAYQCVFDPKFTNLFLNKPRTIPPLGIRFTRLNNNFNLNLDMIATSHLSTLPPWTLTSPLVLLSLNHGNKAATDPAILKQQALELLSKYTDFTFIYTDGSKNNITVSAAVIHENTTITKRLPDHSSIFSAECIAIHLALETINNRNNTKYLILSDSLSTLQAIQNKKFEHPFILNILETYHNLSQLNKTIIFCWIPSHVGIRGNEMADMAAKDALTSQIDQNIRIPYSDLKNKISINILSNWQNSWNNSIFNKLHTVQPTISNTKKTSTINRKDETIMHRLRIGHTRYTHVHLLTKTTHPLCNYCQTPISVEHIFLPCPQLLYIRNKFINGNTLDNILTTNAPTLIIQYLKEILLYSKI